MTAYHREVWLTAMNSAEQDVLRCTAIPASGRQKDEPLESYVLRTRKIQDAAMARWLTARMELDACTPKPESVLKDSRC